MPKKYLLLLISFLIGFNSFAQSELRTQLGEVYYDKNLYKKKYNAPEGSPYLNDEFTAAQINDISETQFVRFNAYEGKIEAKVSANQVVELDGSDTYVILLKDGSGKVYETHSYLDSKGQVVYSFFERIKVTEKYTLYMKEEIKYSQAVKAEAYKEAQPAAFKPADSKFFLNDLWKGSDDLVELPQRPKTFADLFQNQAKSLKNFIKQEKLKLGEREDLVRILDHYFAPK